ncbi:uncharacterized protein F4812DRAFT_460468 [Daldinia caldariorum]|uniref:uncharacterized protein n=1 Tax=Daldinia caldariorum TaxID=326644 RepID=UPI002008A5D8|nr:uncharacterized protein F4812DRAFT_460468 [Daldinia caldariorum]KAI1466910.1 hypothetical protein F4812DRAFT_460468 [Daldinia caldariorum]
MESFSLAAQHAGGINHIHTIRLDPSTAAAKGSPNRRPKITHPTAIPNEQLPQRATEALFRAPLLEPFVGERPRQRRISRKKYGVRVSRRLSSRGGTGESASSGKQYSLMQVSEFNEDHPYWGTLRHSQIPNLKNQATTSVEDKKLCGDRAPSQPVGYKNSSTRKTEHTNPIHGGLRQKGMSTVVHNRGKIREKRFGLADPLVWDAINRSLGQQRQLSTLVIPEDAAVEHYQSSEIPSRTSSQRKALNRFTRQLEKYADATGAAGKVPVMTPTESDSKLSYHTVQPLLPYQKEFQAAGLAVTSAEQSRRPRIKDRDGLKPISSSVKYVHAPVQTDGGFDRQDEALSERSASSSGSYVEFTPAGNPIEPLPVPKSKTKKSISKDKGSILPWLRKKSPSRENRTAQAKPQYKPQSVNDTQVRNQARSRDHQHTPHDRSSLSPRTRPSGLRRKASSRPAAPSANITTRHESPGRNISWIDVEQGDQRLHSGPAAPRASPEREIRQPITHTGLRKRDIAMARLPLPATIKEERESSPIRSPTRTDQSKIQIYPRLEKDVPIPSAEISQRKRTISPQTTPSTLPSLPSAARYAVSRASSLERALDEVSQHLEKLEQEANESNKLCDHPPTLVDRTNQKSCSPYHTDNRASGVTPTRRPRKNEKVIFVNRRMPPVKSPMRKKSSQSPPKPTREAPPLPPPKHSTTKSSTQKKLPKVPQTEDILKDLDVFFDYDDADINDRDVIRGLQVAIHAAADNMYDAMIRERTGLRIRRFLADLRAVGEMQDEDPVGQCAKERLTRSTRLLDTQGEKSIHQGDS